MDAAARLREASVEVHRRGLPQSVLEVGAALANVALSMALLDEADSVAREGVPSTPGWPDPIGTQLSLVVPHLVELSRDDFTTPSKGSAPPRHRKPNRTIASTPIVNERPPWPGSIRPTPGPKYATRSM